MRLVLVATLVKFTLLPTLPLWATAPARPLTVPPTVTLSIEKVWALSVAAAVTTAAVAVDDTSVIAFNIAAIAVAVALASVTTMPAAMLELVACVPLSV
jgi:hypothetical protein